MEKKGKILIIDDNEDILFGLNMLLKPLVDEVRVATRPDQLLRFYQMIQPDVVLMDMNFSYGRTDGREGFDMLHEVLKLDPDAVVILMTAFTETEKVVRAIKEGASDFIEKPWDRSRLLSILFSGIQLRQERRKAQAAGQPTGGTPQAAQPIHIIGESMAMKMLLENLRKVAPTDANVLILGENGTGKDLVARELRRLSSRAESPYVSIDLGAVPENLFESELFGYEKGAFTDAQKAKAGRMEAASGGTLFLDEIGNLSPAMQSKLLTALEKREVSRLGSTKTTHIDVRLICATNANLRSLVAEGRFRQDLFYRINTIELTLPPLRDRGNDILLLARHFLKVYAAKYNRPVPTLNRDAEQKLLKHLWPGNVRELQHSIERALLICNENSLCAADFELEPPLTSSRRHHDTLNLEKMEQEAIERAMQLSHGNVQQAADLLGISRFALYRKLKN